MKKIKYLIISILTLIFLPLQVAAAGGINLSTKSITIEQGASTTFKITAQNAAAELTISSENSSIATIDKTYEWLDNESLTINVTGKKVGTTKIAVGVNAATYDEEVIIETQTITVNVIAKKSSNNNLSSLTVSPKNITFSSSKTSYNLTVENNVTEIKIDAKAEDTKSNINGTGTKKLNVYKNTFDIVVTAENGSKKTYTIQVTRKDADGNEKKLSSNNDLKKLEVKGYNIEFNSNKDSYYLKVEQTVTKVNITATTSDSNAKVTINNIDKLKIGENTITIDVTAEDGSKKTYKLIVERDNGIPRTTLDKLLTIIDTVEVDTIIVDIKDNNNTITKEMLEKLKSTNKKLIVNKYQDEALLYTWEINGKDIKEAKNIDTLLDLYSSSDQKIDELTNYSRYLYFNNNLDTSIFNNIVLKLHIENDYKKIYGYFYQNEKLEEKYSEIKYVDSSVEMKNIELGKYVLMPKELEETQTSSCNHKTLVIIELIIIIILISTLILLIIKQRKENIERY